jgi:hypothetical protein
MYAHCTNCRNYDSGIFANIKLLRQQVKLDGGYLREYENQCPACGEYDCLQVNES